MLKFATFICALSCLTVTILNSEGVGNPVYVTEYLESGKIELARNLTEVRGIVDGVKSYAGYFTVNKTYNSNMYFWYFPAEISPETAPLVLWLEGGPGLSSVKAVFEKHGPFYVDENGQLKKRDYTYWSSVLNVVFIDCPVGAGYSFTDSERGYATSTKAVGKQLYAAIVQFFRLFPDLYGRDFIASGESYAGKFVPSLAYEIYKNNKINVEKINLKGLAIGNGWCDPENMLDTGKYLYEIGLIDRRGMKKYEDAKAMAIEHIRNKDFVKALYLLDDYLFGHITPYKTVFTNLTGLEININYLYDKDYNPYGDYRKFIDKESIRRAMHVGNNTFNPPTKVFQHLFYDFMQSVKPLIEILVENYRILFYNGMLDVMIPHRHTMDFLERLRWTGSDELKSAERKIWRSENDIAGYYITVRGLTALMVRNAGHMATFDQPAWGLDLITKFAFNKPF